MMRLIFLLVICMSLTSCTALLPRLQKQAVPQDQVAFSRAFDEFRASHGIDQLQRFKQDYPDSDWAQRAETIILYALELDRRKIQLEESRTAQQQLQQKLNQEEAAQHDLQQQIEALSLTNQQLTEQIEQLKGLLIQLEKRPQ
ncbi:MAG: hypothetical protein JXQ81_03485 [Desulfuromonadales bacterium]|nr:hypothetical protein [Desulfuromonadales bacterium]MBN2791551.1 hypothetical protein [Desulfuromonadales bacterium]